MIGPCGIPPERSDERRVSELDAVILMGLAGTRVFAAQNDAGVGLPTIFGFLSMSAGGEETDPISF